MTGQNLPNEPEAHFSLGYKTHIGARERNEDFVGAVTPNGEDMAFRGALLAVADGVSGGRSGREAAENTVRQLLADYYATPPTWGIHQALDQVICATNRWLLAQGGTEKTRSRMATTLSCLVLQADRYVIAHVGDTRIYCLRNQQLELLTQDHVWDLPEMQHVLSRAVGLDQHLMMDYLEGEILINDQFLICSDGVWAVLGHQAIARILLSEHEAQSAADALIDQVLKLGGVDNATALVLKIHHVNKRSRTDMLAQLPHLPVPEKLKPGERIDGFEVVDLLHESRATLLYKVRTLSGQWGALKTLQPALKNDAVAGEALLVEESLTKRLVSEHFVRIIPLAPTQRKHLYYVMTYHEGATLQQHIDSGRHFAVSECIQIGMQIARGLSVLHRLGIIHRDIKPANLLQSEQGDIRLLDLGVALATGVPYPEAQAQAGTPSFMAPELFDGHKASEQSDIFAWAVTLYYLLTRHYPYGEVEPFQHPRFLQPVNPIRYRPDIPQWFEAILLRALRPSPAQRFASIHLLIAALEKGDKSPFLVPKLVSPIHRSVHFWRAMTVLSLGLNVLLVYILIII
jgi:protein phosphatase